MTKSRKRRFEAAGTLVLGRAQVGRRSGATHSRSRRARGILIWSLVAVAAGALWLALDARFYIYHVDVAGAVRVSPEEIVRASELPGLHILWARSAEVEDRLLSTLPTLESARVTCGFPAECRIAVVERQPKVTWDEDGLLWWIDAEGVVFHALSSFPPREGEGLRVRGPLPRGQDGRLDERVRVALSELWAAGGDLTSSFDYAPERGLMFTDERGYRVILGQGPGMDRRLRVLELLTVYLEEQGLTPRFVDVRFAGAPYYSLTNDW